MILYIVFKRNSKRTLKSCSGNLKWNDTGPELN